MKTWILGFIIGTILVLPAWAVVANKVFVERSGIQTLPSDDWSRGDNMERYDDNERHVTCYSIRYGRGIALSCVQQSR